MKCVPLEGVRSLGVCVRRGVEESGGGTHGLDTGAYVYISSLERSLNGFSYPILFYHAILSLAVLSPGVYAKYFYHE